MLNLNKTKDISFCLHYRVHTIHARNGINFGFAKEILSSELCYVTCFAKYLFNLKS